MIQNKNKLCVAFRVDSSKTLGLGHLKRCLCVADELSKKGMECIFIISNKNKADIENHGYRVFKVNQNHEERGMIKKILEKEKCSMLIIDSKRKSLIKIIDFIRTNVKVVLIDNLQFANHVDLVVLPGVHEQFKFYPKNSLIGPKYVLINSEFKKLKRKKRKKIILLSAGGTDKKNLTLRIVSGFRGVTSNFKLLVILGKFYTHENRLYNLISNDKRFIVIKDPKNFPQLMSECKVGIITFGITIYEAAFARLPVFVISHSDENDISARRIKKYGWFKYLGKYDSLNYANMAQEIISYTSREDLLKRMSSAGKIIDGQGAVRVVNSILKLVKD